MEVGEECGLLWKYGSETLSDVCQNTCRVIVYCSGRLLHHVSQASLVEVEVRCKIDLQL